MNAAPLAKMGLITMEVNLILAGLIGFGFGFMLERAGFGSAHRLVGQWYMQTGVFLKSCSQEWSQPFSVFLFLMDWD